MNRTQWALPSHSAVLRAGGSLGSKSAVASCQWKSQGFSTNRAQPLPGPVTSICTSGISFIREHAEFARNTSERCIGQLTWTQTRQFILESPAFDPRQVGRAIAAIAVSDNGLTMIVGAKATSGGTTTGSLADGTIETRNINLRSENDTFTVQSTALKAPNTILAVDWNITGTLEHGRIVWSNGTIWKGFDPKLLSDVFANM